jgi:iron complex transport system substrate-binding protein
VIVAAPSFTDYIVKLGCSDKIVGVTDYDMFDAEKIGQLTPLNIEKIISLKPDLIIVAGGFQAAETYKLEKFGLRVICLNPNTLDSIFRTTTYLATILGVNEKGQEVVTEAQNRMLAISRDKAYKIPLDERKSIFYCMISGNAVKDLWTCGQGSYLNEVISLAGGVNITGNYSGANGWLPLSVEFVASKNPDVILVPSYYAGGEATAEAVINGFSPWKDIKAVKNAAMYGIDGNKAAYANLQLIDLIEDIYEILYEEK